MPNLNPYETPIGGTDIAKIHTSVKRNSFAYHFLLKSILIIVVSYLLLPLAWIVMLSLRYFRDGSDLTTLAGEFWQYLFVSNPSSVLLSGTIMATVNMCFLVRSHRRRTTVPNSPDLITERGSQRETDIDNP